MTAFEDRLGVRHDLSSAPRRVVSLVPSLTETLFDIGAGDCVVGITDYCLFPELETGRLPRIGGTKNPKVERIRDLEPDLVYVNVEENLERHAQRIAEFSPVFATEPRTVEDVCALIATLGTIHRVETEAARWSTAIHDEALTARRAERFSFLCPIWKDPWMWCGGDTYVSALIEAAGGRNLLGNRDRYPAVDLGVALDLRPDVVFLPDEPYAFTTEDAVALGRSTTARMVGPFPGHLITWHGTRTLHGLRFVRDAVRVTVEQ